MQEQLHQCNITHQQFLHEESLHLHQNRLPQSLFLKPYKYSLHEMPSFKIYKNSTMIYADDLTKNMISLPLYPGLNDKEQKKVIKVIKKYFNQ